MDNDHVHAASQSRKAIQWLNFFLATVRDGLRPYLGIFGALFLIIIADLTEGTGRFNVTLGAVSTIGAASSSVVAGHIVVHSSYDVAFRSLAGFAFVAFLLFLFFMPKTKDWAQRHFIKPPPCL